MGYILPLQMDQYTQYVNRTTPVKQDYAKVAEVPTVSFDNRVKVMETYEMKKKKKFSEHFYNELTGKGAYINESI